MGSVIARINGNRCKFNNNKHFALYLIEILIYSVSPLDVKLKTLAEIMEMSGHKRRIKSWGKVDTDEKFSKLYSETILAMENLSPLPGFSSSKPNAVKAGYNNPERGRISTDWTKDKNLNK